MASKPCPATEAPCELKGAATGEAHAALPTGRIDGGEATQKLSYGTIQVKNEPGEPKNSIHLQSRWNCDPHLIFAIFTYPDNSALFRDIKRVGSRRVIKSQPGYKEVEVEQIGEVKILWARRTYSTWIHVTEDSRDPECLIASFDLVKSDVLSQFCGRWKLRPVHDPVTGEVVGCDSELHQEVLPHGVPHFLTNLPLLGDLMRGAVMRAIKRVLEDVNAAVIKIKAGMAKGKSLETMMRELCGTFEEQGHSNGAVTSFAVDDYADSEEEEQEAAAGEGCCAKESSDTPTSGSGSGIASCSTSANSQSPKRQSVEVSIQAQPDGGVKLSLQALAL